MYFIKITLNVNSSLKIEKIVNPEEGFENNLIVLKQRE